MKYQTSEVTFNYLGDTILMKYDCEGDILELDGLFATEIYINNDGSGECWLESIRDDCIRDLEQAAVKHLEELKADNEMEQQLSNME